MERRVQQGRRDEVLARLLDFVLDNGFARVCLDDIANSLECSKATLYGIAAGKKLLVAAALREFFSKVEALAAERAAHSADPAGRLAAYLTAIGPEAGRMSPVCYADVAATDMIRDIYGGHVAATARDLHELIGQGVRSGDFRPAHVHFLAEAAAMLADANAQGDLPSRAGLSAAAAQSQLSQLMAATLSNTAYQRRESGPAAGPENEVRGIQVAQTNEKLADSR
jgi:AcrR family transcriptional regulator